MDGVVGRKNANPEGSAFHVLEAVQQGRHGPLQRLGERCLVRTFTDQFHRDEFAGGVDVGVGLDGGHARDGLSGFLQGGLQLIRLGGSAQAAGRQCCRENAHDQRSCNGVE